MAWHRSAPLLLLPRYTLAYTDLHKSVPLMYTMRGEKLYVSTGTHYICSV